MRAAPRALMPALLLALMVAIAMAGALAPAPARAQQATVTLPQIPDLPPAQAARLLRAILHLDTALANCPGAAAGTGERLLVAGTRDRLAEALALDDAGLDALYAPLFTALAKPGFCPHALAALPGTLAMLEAWGGSPALIRG